MKIVKLWVLLLILTTSAYAKPFVEGKDYIDLGKIESDETTDSQVKTSKAKVELFFWYGCDSCYQVFDHFAKWRRADVDFQQTPVVLRQQWRFWAKAYYALDDTKLLDKYQNRIFQRIHIEKQINNDLESLRSLFEPEDFQIFSDEFATASNNFKVKQAERRFKNLSLSSVPSILINDRFLITATLAETSRKMRDTAEYLIQLK